MDFKRKKIPDDTNQAEQNDERNEPHYRATLVYSYPSKFDNIVVESDKVKVDDNDPASVIEHVKRLIRTLRPDCELTDLLLELWDLAPKTIPNDPIKFPFKTYNPLQILIKCLSNHDQVVELYY